MTYENKLSDTHNAMDQNSGMFRAPFAGTYGFIFYFQAHRFGRIQNLYALHNGNRVLIHYVDMAQNAEMDSSNTIYFARYLNPGETIQIESGSANIHMFDPAKFMGFLLNKA